jgi:hypothetical protein
VLCQVSLLSLTDCSVLCFLQYSQITSVIHEDCLDVCYEGFVFRLQIVATPEVEAIQLAAGTPSICSRVRVSVMCKGCPLLMRNLLFFGTLDHRQERC